jgi:hypothetical protein
MLTNTSHTHHITRTLSQPPTSQNINSQFRTLIDSTLNPIVGIVVTTSPNFHMYSIVVLPNVYTERSTQTREKCLKQPLTRGIQGKHQHTVLLHPKRLLPQRLYQARHFADRSVVHEVDSDTDPLCCLYHQLVELTHEYFTGDVAGRHRLQRKQTYHRYIG